ncbi:replication initiation protein [Providencia rettgeri]|uniref:replication initiation protein n=1 Tax=Providencia rettgeri TaxID=587 RepID=UPI00288126A3|nr:replication initiation protein [Providencia rettgeri]ELM3940007.1 replication initiation protein [Providencia rettgeri]EMA4647298.1 replication initiation protein [Providencia rettgeri]EMA4647669.1 replication initiation protein [Providencia rettgeri]MDK3110752.1 replication initiation protein [Providencia rettgeri]
MKKKQLSNLTLFTNVRHSDDFNLSLASLPISAKRVLFLILAQISDPRERVEEEEISFDVTAKQYAEICGVDIKTAYNALPDAVDTLLSSHIYEDLSEEGFKRAFKTNITSGAKYFFDEGYCTVYFNQKVFPYFFELSKKFTTMNLFHVARLSDVNMTNFYQMIMKRYSKSNTVREYNTSFTIGVEELKDEMWLFKLDKKDNKQYLYQNYKDLGQLLKKLARGLSEKTNIKDITITIESRKARKASVLRISYSVIKEGATNSLPTDEELDAIEKQLGLLQ